MYPLYVSIPRGWLKEIIETCWNSLPYADKWILLCSLLVTNSFMYTYCTEDVQYTD